MSIPAQPDVMTLKEAADYLRVSKMTLIRWMKNQHESGIPGQKRGRIYLFHKTKLEQWVMGDLDSPRAVLGGNQ